MKYLLLSFPLVVLLFCTGCDRSDQIPAYVYIDHFDVKVDMDQGTSSQKITDGWVFVNNESIGAYQLPTTIPILGMGETDIVVFPGIKENGVSDLPIIYPALERYQVSLNLAPNGDDTIRPQTRYIDDAEFLIVEDFDGGHSFVKGYDRMNGTNIEITRTNVFEGSGSGIIKLDKDSFELEAAWDEVFFAPNGGQSYIELNYKTNIPFIIGVKGFFAGAPTNYYDAIINPNEDWNKIYFNLTQIIQESNFDLYEIVILALWSESFGVEETEVLIDNFKLIRI